MSDHSALIQRTSRTGDSACQEFWQWRGQRSRASWNAAIAAAEARQAGLTVRARSVGLHGALLACKCPSPYPRRYIDEGGNSASPSEVKC